MSEKTPEYIFFRRHKFYDNTENPPLARMSRSEVVKDLRPNRKNVDNDIKRMIEGGVIKTRYGTYWAELPDIHDA